MILLIKTKKNINKKQFVFTLFIIYCLFLLYILFLNKNFRNDLRMVNMIPFATIQRYINAIKYNYINPLIGFINIGANLFLFVPMGFFVLILFNKKINNIVVFFLLNYFIITLIEIIQYITCTGSADVDDIILNIIGALFGYVLMKSRIGNKIIKKFKE